jgi:hypothetical protein
MNVSLMRQQLHTYREFLRLTYVPEVIVIEGCQAEPGEIEGIAQAGHLRWQQHPNESREAFCARVIHAAVTAGELTIIIGGFPSEPEPLPIHTTPGSTKA